MLRNCAFRLFVRQQRQSFVFAARSGILGCMLGIVPAASLAQTTPPPAPSQQQDSARTSPGRNASGFSSSGEQPTTAPPENPPAPRQSEQNAVQPNPPQDSAGQPTAEGDVGEAKAKGAQQKPPAAIDPNGPATSVETSESVFDMMAALNTCGYDEGLASSDPVRQKVRDDINQALAKSEPARQTRDKLCAYIQSHSLNSAQLKLASYISLALYLTPPPALEPNVAKADLPPDAVPLVGIVPLLKQFSQAVDLHLIWVLNHPAYDETLNKVRTNVAKMLVKVDLYLKQPPAGYGNRRFVVILEPLIAPSAVNARIYGGDYIVVASPVNGTIDMRPVKHTYLHFELEPLIYARSESIDALTPILELVQPAPLPFQYKSDILSLVTECMIRAIEARTMDTGVPDYKPPAHIDRNQLAAVNNLMNAHDRKVTRIRRQKVADDMKQGFILTQYFYNQLGIFASRDTTLQEAVGEMVYGMNVDIEKNRVKDIVFASTPSSDVLQPAPAQPDLLDQAERRLVAGDIPGATQLAQQAIAQHLGDAGRAQFILARADIMSGKMEQAEQAFTQAAKISHDPRTLAWSHIYLGRLDDLQDDRQAAIAQYQEAMKTRDGRSDTRNAAQAGLNAPFAPPGPHRSSSGQSNSATGAASNGDSRSSDSAPVQSSSPQEQN